MLVLCSEQASTGAPQQCSQHLEALKLSFAGTSAPDRETQPVGYVRSLSCFGEMVSQEYQKVAVYPSLF